MARLASRAYWKLTQLVLPHFYTRWDPIFEKRALRLWAKENLSAYKRFRHLPLNKVKHCLIYSYPRGGSHIFASQFHYLPCAFTFGEGFAQPLDVPAARSYRSFLLRSIFGADGLQDKKGSEITHVFYLLNGWISYDYPEFSLGNERNENYRIYYFRNPFRILCSMQHAADQGKTKWNVTDRFFAEFIARYSQLLTVAWQDALTAPTRAAIVFHEVFCAHPSMVLGEVSRFVGLSQDCMARRENPSAFFKRTFGTEQAPALKDGRLTGADDGHVLGGSGQFNPLEEVTVQRTMSGSLSRVLTPERFVFACEMFSMELAEFWRDDSAEIYLSMSENALIDLVGTLLEAGRKRRLEHV